MSGVKPFPEREPIELKDGCVYDPKTLVIRVLNANPFADYREACKITEGQHTNYDTPDNCMADSLCEGQTLQCADWKCKDNRYWHPRDMYKYWLHQFTALHSTVRSIHIRIMDCIPRSVAMQLVRHTAGHPQPYIESSRPDWTGKPRAKDPYELKWCMFDFTPESFLIMCRKRLCNRTEEMTRKIVNIWVEGFKALCVNKDYTLDSIYGAIGELAVPQCEVLGANACPELKCCGKHPKFN